MKFIFLTQSFNVKGKYIQVSKKESTSCFDEATFSSFAKQIHLHLPYKNKQIAIKSLRLKKNHAHLR